MDATRALLAAASLALALAALPAASAIPDGALSLEATGHAALGGLEQVRLELAFSPSQDASFTGGGGLLIIGTSALDTLDIDGAFTRDSRDLRLSGTASGHGEPVSVALTGRLTEERGDSSVYLLTGTLERGGVSGRASFAALLVPIHSDRDPAVTVSVPPAPEGDGARSLHASGYGAVGEFVEDLRLSLSFSEGADGSLSSLNGTLGIGGYSLGTLDIGGEFTREGRFVSVSGTASGRGEPVSLRLLGRTAEAHGGQAAYLLTGTLERPGASRGVSRAQAELDRCDFTRDARIGVTVGPGESSTIHIAKPGIYRILDPESPWIQLLAVSVDTPVRCPPHCH